LVFGCLLVISVSAPARGGKKAFATERIGEVAGAELKAPAGAANPLDAKVNIALPNPQVPDLVAELRGKWHVPISFIEAAGKPQELKITEGLRPLREVITLLVKQLPFYRFEVIRDRMVLYSVDAKYVYDVTGVEIQNLSRIEAANLYVDQLRSRFPEFAELVGPPILGDINSPVFTEPVRLNRSGRVIDHLVQLLGDDPQTVFSLGPARSGVPVLWFDRVR
jgi:hypothetical protein